MRLGIRIHHPFSHVLHSPPTPLTPNTLVGNECQAAESCATQYTDDAAREKNTQPPFWIDHQKEICSFLSWCSVAIATRPNPTQPRTRSFILFSLSTGKGLTGFPTKKSSDDRTIPRKCRSGVLCLDFLVLCDIPADIFDIKLSILFNIFRLTFPFVSSFLSTLEHWWDLFSVMLATVCQPTLFIVSLSNFYLRQPPQARHQPLLYRIIYIQESFPFKPTIHKQQCSLVDLESSPSETVRRHSPRASMP